MSDESGGRMYDADLGAFLYECPECGEYGPIIGVAVTDAGDGRPVKEPLAVLGCGGLARIASLEAGPNVEDGHGDGGTRIDID